MVRLNVDDLPADLRVQVLGEDKAATKAAIAELDPLPAKGSRSDVVERDFQNNVVRPLAKALGWWVYHPQLSKWSERGWPDLSMLRGSRLLFVECKRDDTTITPDQLRVILRLRAAGQEVHIWRPATPEAELLEVLR